MYYYAQYSPYGIRTLSNGNRLYRFSTRAARDSVVDNEEWDGSNYHWSVIYRDQARYLYPDAFRVFDDNYYSDYEEWTLAEKIGGEMWPYSPSGGDYRYF